MKITINKSEIFNEVEKRTSLEGAMIPERYDNIWSSPSKGELLDSYWVEGCTVVVSLFKRYISNASVTHSLIAYDKDEVFELEATMPERYDSFLDGSVVTAIKMMIACNIVRGWLSVVSPTVSSKYDEEANRYGDDLRLKLLHRIEPESTAVDASADSDSINKTEVTLNTAVADEVSLIKEEKGLITAVADEVDLKQCYCKCNVRML